MFEFALILSSVIVHFDNDVALDSCEMIEPGTMGRESDTDTETARWRHILSPQNSNEACSIMSSTTLIVFGNRDAIRLRIITTSNDCLVAPVRLHVAALEGLATCLFSFETMPLRQYDLAFFCGEPFFSSIRAGRILLPCMVLLFIIVGRRYTTWCPTPGVPIRPCSM